MDVLGPGSIWDEPRDWMMAMLKKERLLLSIWEKGFPKSGLKLVGVKATALSREMGFVSVEYSFDNEPQCSKELKAAKASVF
jgi:hypothetical protein